jgi:hypothetical protein
MKNYSEHEANCLRDERDRLVDEVRRCDFCSTSMAEHRHCYEETAKASGRRSRACMD